MDNREKLEAADILKKGAKYTDEELAALDSLTEEEVDVVISRQDTLKDVVKAHKPVLSGIGTHHIVGFPDEEKPDEG